MTARLLCMTVKEAEVKNNAFLFAYMIIENETRQQGHQIVSLVDQDD